MYSNLPSLKGTHTISNADWLDALDLSTMWMFDEVSHFSINYDESDYVLSNSGIQLRNKVIQALDPWIASQDAKQVVLLAKKYRILKWLKDGYTRLLQQPSLTADELSAAPSLDWKTIAKLLSVKLTQHHQLPQRQQMFGYAVNETEALPSAMRKEFGEEFSSMSDGESKA